ncbi:hypothetical protein WOC76_18260 [Methylocystis sp. IM3]|uniref:hypothetical protein n=1 Tax=unclassified Methylocystis TaxID=2625913 RepID=UPI000FA7E876|nr:MAG: hypothetical protein EKK29_16320 [Hyphomicrobiales bacterium]
MSHAYLIEIEQDTVGLIVREAEGYRFYATRRSLSVLQSDVFGTAREARDAIVALHGRADAMRASMTPLTPLSAAE